MGLNHLPETYLGNYLSELRLINGLCSLAIAIIGSVSLFKNKENRIAYTLVQLVGLTFFFLSLSIGLKTNRDFAYYLDELSEMKDLSDFYKIRVKEWMKWITYFYIYFALIVIVTFLFIFKIDKLKAYFFSKMKHKK